MSGVPNMPDIALLRDALAEINKERAAIEKAGEDRAHCDLRIDQAQQRLAKAEKEMRRLMDAMDCSSTGNHGYPNRMIALLTGLAQHAEEYGRKHK